MNTNTLSLRDILSRSVPPAPWTEGDNIPWNDPAFSERMLREHLSQVHDLATRRASIVDAHVRHIHTDILQARTTRILDLACGPGLYAHRLARLGHHCDGIDFSPASIRFAQQASSDEQLGCRFVQSDLRKANFETGYGLVMMIYGQFNVFRRHEAHDLLARSHVALAPGGKVLLEVQTENSLRTAADATPTWYTCPTGLFSEMPHLTLHERFWNEHARCSTERWHVVDLESGAVTRHALSCEAYSINELSTLMREVGFANVETFPLLKGSPPESPMFVICAAKE